MGPAGYGIVSQLSNFQVMMNNIISLGVPVGLTAKVSEVYSTKSESYKERVNAYWSFFIKLTLLISISSTITLLIFSDFFTVLLIGSNEYKLVFAIIILSLPFSVSNVIIDSFLKSFGAISSIVKISIFSAIGSLLILIPLLFYFEIIGVSISIVAMSSLPILIFVIFFRKDFKDFFRNGYSKLLSKEEKVNVFKIGIVSVLAAFMHQGAIIAIRKLIIVHFGEADNGIYQSVLGLSLNYFAVVYALLSNYTLPKFASLPDNISLVAEINNTLRFLLIIIIPAILMIFAFRDVIIKLIYTSEFLKAQELFMFQLIGDIFRMFAALFGLWLIPRMKIIQLLSIDFIFNLILISLPFLLIYFFGKNLILIPIAYMSAFFVHFVLYFSFTMKSIGFRFTRENLVTLGIAIIILSLGFGISNLNMNAGHLFVIILIATWLIMVISKREKKLIIEKIQSLVNRRK